MNFHPKEFAHFPRAFEHIEPHLVVDVVLFIDGKRHRVTPGYAMTIGGVTAFKVVYGKHSKTRLNVRSPGKHLGTRLPTTM
jgi:hypothetical protein